MAFDRVTALLGKELFERDVKRNRDGELMEQAVSLDVRLLVGAVAVMLLWLMLRAGVRFAIACSPITLAMAAVAVFGWRVAVIDPEASARFRGARGSHAAASRRSLAAAERSSPAGSPR